MIAKYGKLEQELLDLCRAYPPDLDTIQAKIREGADVNAGNRNGNLLGDLLYEYGWILENEGMPNENLQRKFSGKYLPDIVTIFIESGFDVSRFDNAYGGDALFNLVFAPQDRACFEVAELLLKAGANPHYIPPNECEDVLEAVRFHGSLALDDALTWGSGQEDLTEGEFCYRLYLFMKNWPAMSIDECLRGWQKMIFEEWEHTWPANLPEYLLQDDEIPSSGVIRIQFSPYRDSSS